MTSSLLYLRELRLVGKLTQDMLKNRRKKQDPGIGLPATEVFKCHQSQEDESIL